VHFHFDLGSGLQSVSKSKTLKFLPGNIPGTWHFPATPEMPLQRMLLPLTLSTGLLLLGRRTQVSAWSAPATQSCWKVAWPIARPAEARSARVDFMLSG
jgi:hypothetical protein